MKKQIVLSMIILVCLLSATGCKTKNKDNEVPNVADTITQTPTQEVTLVPTEVAQVIDSVKVEYSNQFLSFVYPKEWTIEENNTEDASYVRFNDSNLIKNPVFYFSHGEAWQVELNRTKDDYQTLLSESYPGVMIQELIKTKIDKDEANSLVYTYTLDGTEYMVIQYDVVHGVSAYQFVFTFPSEFVEEYKNTVADMVSSIAFTEDASVGANSSNVGDNKIVVASYSMKEYTTAPNQASSILIRYPVFEGTNVETLNQMVLEKVEGFATIDTQYFSSDTGLTIDFESAVTLNNDKIVSIIYWGYSNVEGSAHPYTVLYAMNIDTRTLQDIKLEDLYNVSEGFSKIFFEKSYFPSNPVTSYDESTYKEMLKLQTPEYSMVDPFTLEGNVIYFLKPSGIVFSMPAVHATGSDHFEGEVKYEDLSKFYKLDTKYWE